MNNKVIFQKRLFNITLIIRNNSFFVLKSAFDTLQRNLETLTLSESTTNSSNFSSNYYGSREVDITAGEPLVIPQMINHIEGQISNSSYIITKEIC